MKTLRAKLSLRPTRIGFLLRPTDTRSLRRIMRLCACLWGGAFNPIIPVCRVLPRAWRDQSFIHLTGSVLTRGYVQFFQPDVYVEAQPGLAEECGVTADDMGIGLRKRVVTLDEFVTLEDGRRPEFAFGLNIFDLYRDLYNKEYKFEPRHKRNVFLFEGRSESSAFLEAASGTFPREDELSFIRQGYLDAFEPAIRAPNADNWIAALRTSAAGPLSFTTYGIDRQPVGSWGPRVFIADPRSAQDIIDLWNLRLHHDDVLPFNLLWLTECRESLRALISRSYRPLPGNSHGVMISTTVEFGRSISSDIAEEVRGTILNDLPTGSWASKLHYDPIWETRPHDVMPQKKRAQIVAKSQSLELVLKSEDEQWAEFASLSPDFARPFGAQAARWVNVVSASDFSGKLNLALTLPSTPTKLISSRLRRGQDLIVSDEGFALPQCYKDHTEFLWLFSGSDAIEEWFSERGIIASPSDSGRITDRVLAAVGGFWGAHIIADVETIRLLDKMSKSVRTDREGANREEYPDRTAHVKQWLELIKRRNAVDLAPNLDVQSFVEAGALRLGLEILCPICEYKNWYGVGSLNERLTCDRCLRDYDFPQGRMNFGNTPWRYRVTGPFSVPNYAEGAYATVLTLRCLTHSLSLGRSSVSYSSNLNLSVENIHVEIDFACWYARDQLIGPNDEPWFVVGEAKSFAEEAVQETDLRKLKLIATKLPGTVLIVAVLKDRLSIKEKKIVGGLALWGRRLLVDGSRRAPVVVLTGTELFAVSGVERAWKKLGGLRQQLAEPGYVRLDNLLTLANLTQQVYLDLTAWGP